jgi:hypothetical protein
MTCAPLFGNLVPVHSNIWLTPLIGVLEALLSLLLLRVTYLGIRKDRVEGVLAPVLLVVVSWNGAGAFDRIARMAQQTVSAAEMASAAQTFGQQDDITVLRVERDRADTPTVIGAKFAEASMG